MSVLHVGPTDDALAVGECSSDENLRDARVIQSVGEQFQMTHCLVECVAASRSFYLAINEFLPMH